MRGDIQSKLRLWPDGAGKAEVFVNSFLSSLGVYPPLTNVAPLGGPDRGRDLQSTDGVLRVACYFPVKEYKSFSEIEAKFLSDMNKAKQGGATQFVFVTGQLMQLADKEKLKAQSLMPNTSVYDCGDILNAVSAPQAGFLRAALGFPDKESSFEHDFFETLFGLVSFKKLVHLLNESLEPRIYPHAFFEIFDNLDIFNLTAQPGLLSQDLRDAFTGWADAVDGFCFHLLKRDLFDYVYANQTFVMKRLPSAQYEAVFPQVSEAFSSMGDQTLQLARLVEQRLRIHIR